MISLSFYYSPTKIISQWYCRYGYFVWKQQYNLSLKGGSEIYNSILSMPSLMIYTAVSVFFLKQLYSNSVSSYINRYIHTQTVAPVKWDLQISKEMQFWNFTFSKHSKDQNESSSDKSSKKKKSSPFRCQPVKVEWICEGVKSWFGDRAD